VISRVVASEIEVELYPKFLSELKYFNTRLGVSPATYEIDLVQNSRMIHDKDCPKIQRPFWNSKDT
jgi:hypothetical protein